MGGRTSRLDCEGRRSGIVTSKPAIKYKGLLFQDQQYLGRGKLEITKEDIIFHRKLRETLVWPIRSVRRYGCEKDAFSFESGRCCVSGPGFYTFQSKQASRILSSVQETASQVAAADRSARLEIPNHRYTSIRRRPLPVQPGKDEGNLYINCDNAGRVVDWSSIDGSPDTRSSSKKPETPGKKSETPGIHYADLDLGALQRSPPQVTGAIGQSKEPVNLPTRSPRLDTVTYVKIDPTKSLAAAKLARSRS